MLTEVNGFMRNLQSSCGRIDWNDFALLFLVNRLWKLENSYFRAVPTEGIEPTHCCQYWILSPARLPIPPRRLVLAEPNT
jgi:hypothetical protein